MKRTLSGVLILFAFFFGQRAIAQCDCDFVVSLSATEWQFDGAAHGVKPGDKICFAGGTRTGILFKNIHGTAAQPVIITNMCNSSVVIDAPSNYGNAVTVENSSFFRFTGSGNPSIKHGIEIKGAVMGINFLSLSTDFEVDHLYVHDTGCVGIVAKTDPTCDSKTWRGNFTMRNTSFHDNIISKTGCEGFYIGNSHYETGVVKTCNGSSLRIQEHDVVNVKVFNNELSNIGNDGIQIGGVISGAEVHDNTVNNFGTLNNVYHTNGFQAGSGTQEAKVFNNVITNGNGYCFFDQGGGSVYYNNIATNGKMGGFSLQDVAGTYAPAGFIVSNNNIINCGEFGILNYSENPNTTRIVNNIIVSTIPGYPHVKYNSSTAKSRTVESNNLKLALLQDLRMVNPLSGDFRLLSSSPAVDAGTDMKAYGITRDLENNPRPSGSAFDVGAFEFNGAGPTPPIAVAGADKTIILPANSITITGRGTDADGEISAYLWSKVSGGSATLSNERTASLSVTNMIAGVYVFRLTVTDNSGASASDDVSVTVKANAAPIAKAGQDKTIILPTNSASFTGSGSDTDGTISSYSWQKVSGGTASLANANTAVLSVSGVVAGTYVFRLTVKDNNGAVGTDDVALVVKANAPPIAMAGSDKKITLPENTTTFSGSGTDSDGTIAKYSWTKVSGGSATLSNQNTKLLTVSGLSAGTYRFRLAVTDNYGATASDDVQLQVAYNSISQFNFTNEPQNIHGWVDVAGAPHSAVITAVDPSSNYKVSSISTAQWPPAYYGVYTTSFNGGVKNGTVQDAGVVATNWFNYNAPFGSTVNGVVQRDNIRISNLDPTHIYKIQIGASRQTGGGTADQYGAFEYRLNQSDIRTLVVTDNGTRQVEYAEVKPNQNGEIGISARKIKGSSMNFGYVGWLVITDLTKTTGQTVLASGRSVATSDASEEIVSSEEEISLFGREYPAGYEYSVVLYSGTGRRIFAGDPTTETFDELIQPGALYIYHVLQNGRRIYTGKFIKQ